MIKRSKNSGGHPSSRTKNICKSGPSQSSPNVNAWGQSLAISSSSNSKSLDDNRRNQPSFIVANPSTNIWGQPSSSSSHSSTVISPGNPRHKSMDTNKEDKNVAQKKTNWTKFFSQRSLTSAYPDGKGGDNFFGTLLWQELILGESLMQGLKDFKYFRPTGIQGKVLMKTLKNESGIVQSQSGTGKTTCYILTILSQLNLSKLDCQAIVLVPIHELALQVVDMVRRVGENLPGLKVIGATPINTITSCHVMVGTVGTVANWTLGCSTANVKLNAIKCLIFDDADLLMLTPGFPSLAESLCKRCANAQKLAFSSTFDQTSLDFYQNCISGFQMTLNEQYFMPRVVQKNIICPKFHEKLNTLEKLLTETQIQKCLVFCSNDVEILRIADSLQSSQFQVGMFLSQMTPSEKINVFERFQDSLLQILVSSNHLSRGVYLDDLELVVNWDQPDLDTYLHRICRSVKFGSCGYAINLVTEKCCPLFDQIEFNFGISIPTVDFGALIQ